MIKTLAVYLNETLVGYLEKNSNLYSFYYDFKYLNSPNAVSISISLPKSNEVYSGNIVESFFEGLLPDDNIRKIIAKILNTSVNNTFSLLEHLGGDCAGAISLHHPDAKISYKKNDIRTLTHNEAYEILSNLKKNPLCTEKDYRVSSAGAQDKLIACVIDNKISLPLNSRPSTHIIKPNIEGFYDTTYNELFCMKLADKCGLPTPPCTILKINNEPFYIVERYDRKTKDGKTIRLHQEDFCQILGIFSNNKYQSDGGPSFKDMFNILKLKGLDSKSKINLLDLIIFNYLIGNGDAHGKNFSILYNGEKPSLAPCYDLMCTTILFDYYPKVKTAMKYNSSYKISTITRDDFYSLDIGIKPSFILKRLDKISSIIISQSELLKEELNNDENTKSDIYSEIIKLIKNHVKKVSL